MKSKLSRRQSREQAFLLAFERNFNNETVEELCKAATESRDFEIDDFALGIIKRIEKNEEQINEIIEQNENGWKIKRISKTALSILQLSVCELRYSDMSDIKAENPVSVVINEAVLLAKKYSSDKDAAFVNGVLGAVARSESTDE